TGALCLAPLCRAIDELFLWPLRKHSAHVRLFTSSSAERPRRRPLEFRTERSAHPTFRAHGRCPGYSNLKRNALNPPNHRAPPLRKPGSAGELLRARPAQCRAACARRFLSELQLALDRRRLEAAIPVGASSSRPRCSRGLRLSPIVASGQKTLG